MASELSEEDCSALMRLEEAMWREETRFDKAFMERALAPDFFELGKVLPTLARRSRPKAAILSCVKRSRKSPIGLGLDGPASEGEQAFRLVQ